MRQLKTTALGAPYHLICATLNWIGQRSDKTQGQQEQFLLSRAFCGSESTQYQRTHDYSSGTCDLANAVAISGAALSPFQGTNPLVCVLLFLLNIRLGQWLPHPGKGCLPASMSPAELLYRLVRNWFCRTQDWNYFFVTDGGHFDNLGLESLLDRRCRLIVVSDATCDPNSTFGDFLRVHQRMRIRRGIKLCALEYGGELPLGELQPQAEDPKLCRNHFFVGRIMYPADQDQPASDGYLIYLKPTFTGDEGLELLEYRKQSGEFPNDSTADQFYPPDRFEAYRKLGYHIGESLCGAEMPRIDRPGETCSLLQFLEGLVRREEGTESSKDLLQRVREDLPVDVHPGNIGSYIEALASADPEAIELVTKILKLEYVDSSDAAMLATLLPYLEHDNPTIRAVLVRIVGKLRPTPPTCRDWLETRRQRDDDPGVQEAVAEVLKTLG